jgi:hypothetical protein
MYQNIVYDSSIIKLDDFEEYDDHDQILLIGLCSDLISNINECLVEKKDLNKLVNQDSLKSARYLNLKPNIIFPYEKYPDFSRKSYCSKHLVEIDSEVSLKNDACDSRYSNELNRRCVLIALKKLQEKDVIFNVEFRHGFVQVYV